VDDDAVEGGDAGVPPHETAITSASATQRDEMVITAHTATVAGGFAGYSCAVPEDVARTVEVDAIVHLGKDS
jgi:hypothetical protein